MLHINQIKFYRSFIFRSVFVGITITVMFIASILVFYKYVTRYVEKEIWLNSDFITMQSKQNSDFVLEQVSSQVFQKYNLEQLLSKPMVQPYDTEINFTPEVFQQWKQWKIKNALDEFLYTTPNTNWVIVCDLNGQLYSSCKDGHMISHHTSSDYIKKDFQTAFNLHGKVFWQSETDGTISLSRILYNMDNMELCGFVIVNITSNAISGMFENTQTQKNGDFVLLDSKGQPLLFTDKDICRFVVKASPAANTNITTHTELTEGKVRYELSSIAVNDRQMTLVYITNLSKKQDAFTPITVFFLSIGTCTLLFTTLFMLLLFKTAARKIIRILNNIEQVANGGICIPNDSSYGDEFDMIHNHIAIMSQKTQALMAKIAMEEKARQDAKYQMLQFRYHALQAQINPHFLFNVLESINGIAKINHDFQVSNLVCRLSRMFRWNLNRTMKFCSLEDEILYIENYLQLYKEMYPDKLTVIYEIDDALKKLKIPTFILQPIVENAIIHGIERKIGPGIISIKAYIYEHQCILSIRDNGNGIEKNKLLNILKHLNCNNESESQESSGHIGITNVHERIRLLYGSQYGVQIQTKAFEFTEVHLFIPFEGEED